MIIKRIPFYGLNKLRGCKYLPEFVRCTKKLFQWEIEPPSLLFYQKAPITNNCKCISFSLCGISIHYHYGFHDACLPSWPKFRIRSIRIFGKKIPLVWLYYEA